jgi:hypothetical protein
MPLALSGATLAAGASGTFVEDEPERAVPPVRGVESGFARPIESSNYRSENSFWLRKGIDR